MTITLDGIIFSLQRHGGITVYFRQLLEVMASPGGMAAQLSLEAPLRQDVGDLPGGLPTTIRPGRRLERFRACRVPAEATVFHSSYYRLPDRRSLPSVVTVHDFIYERFRRGPQRWAHVRQKHAAIRAAQAVICISEATRQDLLEWVGETPGQSVHVIHNGVAELFRPLGSAPSAQQPFMLFVGERGATRTSAWCSKRCGICRIWPCIAWGWAPAGGRTGRAGRLGAFARAASGFRQRRGPERTLQPGGLPGLSLKLRGLRHPGDRGDAGGLPGRVHRLQGGARGRWATRFCAPRRPRGWPWPRRCPPLWRRRSARPACSAVLRWRARIRGRPRTSARWRSIAPSGRHEAVSGTEQRMIRISVVTAVFNRRETVAQALDSVLSQTHPAVESVVVDGASTDGTLEVLETYRSRLGVFVSEPDRGSTMRSTRASGWRPVRWSASSMPTTCSPTSRCWPRLPFASRIRRWRRSTATWCMSTLPTSRR